MKSHVVVYKHTLGHLNEVTYQCIDSLKGYQNIPHAKLELCSQDRQVYVAIIN